MAAKSKKKNSSPRNLYLYLTIAFFLAIIAIFVFDGYMGLYDTVTIATQEQEETIEPDRWLRDNYTGYTWADEGQDVHFYYELDNRRFSSYSADVEVAVWFGETKHSVLLSQPVTIEAFGKAELEWTVDTAELHPADIPENLDFEFSVIINRDGVERKMVVHVAPLLRY